MKLSNFQFKERRGRSCHDWTYHGTVEVTEGCLFWKKTVTRPVSKKFMGSWFFADTGRWTPGWQMEALARAYSVTHGVEL